MTLTIYYAPRTRSFTAVHMLEELGEPYELESFELASGRHKEPDYLALNPMGKVPLVVHDGVPVAELGAIGLYLADRFPGAGLAPEVTDPARAEYLRWAFFASAIIEPALAQKFMKWEGSETSLAWGSFERMVEAARLGVAKGPWLLGERFSMADVLAGGGLRYAVKFGALPAEGSIGDYVKRLEAREAFVRAEAIEARESERFPPVAP